MTTSDQQDIASNRRIYIGLAAGLFLALALNVAFYFFSATPSEADAAKFRIPQVHKLGVPRTFWVEDKVARRPYANLGNQPPESEFYWGAFLLDVVFALGIAIGCAQWYEKRETPAVTPPEDLPPTSTPK